VDTDDNDYGDAWLRLNAFRTEKEVSNYINMHGQFVKIKILSIRV